MIPGLESANFVKYGVMHRNTYINSTKLLEPTYQLKSNRNIYFAGQITGVEGYVESISSGLVSALNAIEQYNQTNKEIVFSDLKIFLKENPVLRDELEQKIREHYGFIEKIKDKKLKYSKLADRAIEEMRKTIQNI